MARPETPQQGEKPSKWRRLIEAASPKPDTKSAPNNAEASAPRDTNTPRAMIGTFSPGAYDLPESRSGSRHANVTFASKGIFDIPRQKPKEKRRET